MLKIVKIYGKKCKGQLLGCVTKLGALSPMKKACARQALELSVK